MQYLISEAKKLRIKEFKKKIQNIFGSKFDKKKPLINVIPLIQQNKNFKIN